MANEKFTFGQYFRQFFDINRDGRVSAKEFFSVLVPSQAVGIALFVVDVLALVAEYRVWDVGMTITGGDAYKSIGFVLVSLLPFYLGQVLWLYPNATSLQQWIAGGMVVASLLTSAQFGLADLGQDYDVSKIVGMVVWLTFGYICALLIYVLSDTNIKMYRAKVKAASRATQLREAHLTGREVMKSVRESLTEENALRAEFGDEAVDSHMSLVMEGGKKKDKTDQRQPDRRPPAPNHNQTRKPKHQNQPKKVYPVWNLGDLLSVLELPKPSAMTIAKDCHNENDFYQAMVPYGIHAVDISRENFKELYFELIGGAPNPQNPPRPTP